MWGLCLLNAQSTNFIAAVYLSCVIFSFLSSSLFSYITPCPPPALPPPSPPPPPLSIISLVKQHISDATQSAAVYHSVKESTCPVWRWKTDLGPGCLVWPRPTEEGPARVFGVQVSWGHVGSGVGLFIYQLKPLRKAVTWWKCVIKPSWWKKLPGLKNMVLVKIKDKWAKTDVFISVVGCSRVDLRKCLKVNKSFMWWGIRRNPPLQSAAVDGSALICYSNTGLRFVWSLTIKVLH